MGNIEQFSSRSVKEFTDSTVAALQNMDTVENHQTSRNIVDWLKDPKNQFTDSSHERIVRSSSSVHSRPLCNFLKNSFYASLRQSSKEEDEVDMDLDSFKDTLQNRTKSDIKSEFYQNMDKWRSNVYRENKPRQGQSHPTKMSPLKRVLVVTDVKHEKSDIFNRPSPIESNRKNKHLYEAEAVDTALYGTNTDKCKMTHKGKKVTQKKPSTFAKELSVLSPEMAFYFPNPVHDSSETQWPPSESEASVSTESMSVASTVDSQFSSRHAILKGSTFQLRRMADEGFDFNSTDENGYSAIHYGAIRGNRDIISLILHNGGNVWKRSEQKELAVELSSNLSTKMLLTGATMFYKEERGVENEHHLQMKPMSFEL